MGLCGDVNRGEMAAASAQQQNKHEYQKNSLQHTTTVERAKTNAVAQPNHHRLQ
jgi:hypothetical protein